MNNAELFTMVNDALWDAFNHYHMGITAENICDQWGLTRRTRQVRYGARTRLIAKETHLIVPVEVKTRKPPLS